MNANQSLSEHCLFQYSVQLMFHNRPMFTLPLAVALRGWPRPLLITGPDLPRNAGLL